MKTLKEIQENYLAIDFFLSMSCNKNCHYCTSYTLEMRNLTVDMDFLRNPYQPSSFSSLKYKRCNSDNFYYKT